MKPCLRYLLKGVNPTELQNMVQSLPDPRALRNLKSTNPILVNCNLRHFYVFFMRRRGLCFMGVKFQKIFLGILILQSMHRNLPNLMNSCERTHGRSRRAGGILLQMVPPTSMLVNTNFQRKSAQQPITLFVYFLLIGSYKLVNIFLQFQRH